MISLTSHTHIKRQAICPDRQQVSVYEYLLKYEEFIYSQSLSSIINLLENLLNGKIVVFSEQNNIQNYIKDVFIKRREENLF